MILGEAEAGFGPEATLGHVVIKLPRTRNHELLKENPPGGEFFIETIEAKGTMVNSSLRPEEVDH